MVIEGERRFRLQFADRVALALAFRKYDLESVDRQVELARDGSIAFVNFATAAWQAYIETRGLSLGEPEPHPPDSPTTG